jgi:hypothetical protein
VTQLPNTPDKLRQLIEQAQAELERLESRPVPWEAIYAYQRATAAILGVYDSVECVERGLRAAYPHLKAAWEGSDWIDWAGGECPVDDRQLVRVKFRDGSASCSRASHYEWFHDGPEHLDGGSDIVAYRVREEDG